MNFNHYFTNQEVESTLKRWLKQYPTLISLQSIGESYEKRPIWLITLTNSQTGPDTEKPALWFDANIHATEISGTTVALHIAHTLLSGYGKDEQITRLLDNGAYYIAPRVNPDGAHLALSKTPRYIRSGVRIYPWPEKNDGLHEEDIDGDGRVLQMRLKDPTGDWKVSSLDPRLLEKRLPTEYGGDYYRVFPEGKLENFDGYQIKMAAPPEGLDFNRNFPFEWRTEGDQQGAGPYPASEPEIKAMVDFIVKHPNISLAVTYHTYSRVILRPFSTKPDDDMETNDLWTYKKIGQIGTDLTGYRNVSIYHDFKYHPKEVITGGFDDWVYDHLGAYAFTIELWDLPTEVGIKDRKFIEWYRDHPHEQDLQILKWVDKHAGKDAYVDWYEYDHPQLGKIELGGWDHMYTWRNPPLKFIAAEAKRQTPFALALGDILPRLAIHALQVTSLGKGNYRINLVVENAGYLPSYTSEQGKKRKAIRPVRTELELPDGVLLVNGKTRVELGHLEGRSNKFDVSTCWGESPTDNRLRTEWVVSARPGSVIKLHVRSERAGTIHQDIKLD